MITREVAAGLLCFRQTDHARLAGRLAARWGTGLPPLSPRKPVLLAIGHHDAGWAEPDRRPVLDPATGAPHTYLTHGLASALAVADRSIERVARRNPYAGWLVARHFLSFHGRDDRAEIRAWRKATTARLAALLAEARGVCERRDLEPEILAGNLDRLQLLDAVSLGLCQAWPFWQGRPMALREAEPTRFRYRTTRAGDLRVEGLLEPWPFAPDVVRESIPARRLAGRRWRDEADLQRGWDEAPAVRVELLLSSRGGPERKVEGVRGRT